MMQQPSNPEELLCATEVCRLLKISRRTFCRLRESGRLPPPAVQWNKTSLRWRRADILAMIGPPLNTSQQQTALVTASRHITAAASAIAAGHHAAAAANAIRQLAINSAPSTDSATAQQQEQTPQTNEEQP